MKMRKLKLREVLSNLTNATQLRQIAELGFEPRIGACSKIECLVIGPASQVALVVKNLLGKCKRHKRRGFDPWLRKIPWRRA